MTNEQMQQYRALADEIILSAAPLPNPMKIVDASAAIVALLAEVERLRGELAAEQARPKLEPTDAENEAAAARIERIDALLAQYGRDKTQWPLALLRELRKLNAEQNIYEARYCQTEVQPLTR